MLETYKKKEKGKRCYKDMLFFFRVRDELRMTLLGYQTLYESSIAFGIRKALKAEQGEQQKPVLKKF